MSDDRSVTVEVNEVEACVTPYYFDGRLGVVSTRANGRSMAVTDDAARAIHAALGELLERKDDDANM